MGNKEITSFSKFLAAQHAVQNAYYDTGKVPNIDEVKKYSSYSYYSKHMTSKSAAIGMLWFLMMLLHHLPIPWNFLGILLVLPITVLLGRRNLLFFFQFLVVSKPSDIHYQTALAALETYIDIIDSIKISVTYVSMDELEADLKPDCDSCAGLSESQNNA